MEKDRTPALLRGVRSLLSIATPAGAWISRRKQGASVLAVYLWPHDQRMAHDAFRTVKVGDARAPHRRLLRATCVAPSSKYHVEDVHNSGCIHTILGSINRGRPDLLHLDCATVSRSQSREAGPVKMWPPDAGPVCCARSRLCTNRSTPAVVGSRDVLTYCSNSASGSVAASCHRLE